ncbi:MAG TPA: O-antigen ligase family protein [Thermoanaerobaculia bacterium]|nr:O-antigen ligase family protein [Thermoanaerobaculia bacterium]
MQHRAATGADATALAQRLPPALTVSVLAAAAAAGVVVVRHGELLVLGPELTPADVLGAAAAALVGVLLVVRPAFALVAVVLFVELHLSEVLVRFHGLPSLLRLLSVPFAVLVLLSRPPGELARLLRRPLLVLLSAHAALAAASSFWAAEPEIALAAASSSIKASFVALVAAVLLDSLARLRVALWSAVGAGSLLGTLAILQAGSGRYDLDFGGLARVKLAQIWGDVFHARVAGPLGDPNFFAQALVVLVPMALALGWTARRRREAALAFGATLVLLAAIGLTYSRGAAVAAAVALALSFLGHGIDLRRALAAALLVAVVFVGLPEDLGRRLSTLSEVVGDPEGESLHPDSSFAKRRLVTRAAWRMFLDHPWAGVGAGNYSARFAPYGDLVGSPAQDYDDPGERHFPHSFVLEVAAESGVVGLALMAAIVAAALATVVRSARRFERGGSRGAATLARALGIGLVAYLIASLFLHLRFERYLWLLFGLVAALPGLALSQRRGEGDAEGAE